MSPELNDFRYKTMIEVDVLLQGLSPEEQKEFLEEMQSQMEIRIMALEDEE